MSLLTHTHAHARIVFIWDSHAVTIHSSISKCSTFVFIFIWFAYFSFCCHFILLSECHRKIIICWRNLQLNYSVQTGSLLSHKSGFACFFLLSVFLYFFFFSQSGIRFLINIRRNFAILHLNYRLAYEMNGNFVICIRNKNADPTKRVHSWKCVDIWWIWKSPKWRKLLSHWNNANNHWTCIVQMIDLFNL